jgi:hypothetical protein
MFDVPANALSLGTHSQETSLVTELGFKDKLGRSKASQNCPRHQLELSLATRDLHKYMKFSFSITKANKPFH